MNLADEYMGPAPSPRRWRDLSIAIGGSRCLALDAIFRADWLAATGEKLTPASPCPRFARQRPGARGPQRPDVRGDPLYDALLHRPLPRRAPLLGRHALLHPRRRPPARARGRRPARGRRAHHRARALQPPLFADLVAAPYLRELADAGVQVRRYLPGMLHAKAVLADDDFAAVGSANFDQRSLFLNYEVALFLSGGPRPRASPPGSTRSRRTPRPGCPRSAASAAASKRSPACSHRSSDASATPRSRCPAPGFARRACYGPRGARPVSRERRLVLLERRRLPARLRRRGDDRVGPRLHPPAAVPARRSLARRRRGGARPWSARSDPGRHLRRRPSAGPRAQAALGILPRPPGDRPLLWSAPGARRAGARPDERHSIPGRSLLCVLPRPHSGDAPHSLAFERFEAPLRCVATSATAWSSPSNTRRSGGRANSIPICSPPRGR